MENNGQQRLLLRDKTIFEISSAILFFLFFFAEIEHLHFFLGGRRQFYVRGIMKEWGAGKKIGGSYPPRQRAIPPKFQFSRSSKSSSAVRMRARFLTLPNWNFCNRTERSPGIANLSPSPLSYEQYDLCPPIVTQI